MDFNPSIFKPRTIEMKKYGAHWYCTCIFVEIDGWKWLESSKN